MSIILIVECNTSCKLGMSDPSNNEATTHKVVTCNKSNSPLSLEPWIMD
jgi:hypothetical protein